MKSFAHGPCYGIHLQVGDILASWAHQTRAEQCLWRHKRTLTSSVLTGAENLATAVTARRELRVVAVAAVDLVGLGAELLVDQRHAAFVAQEARLVPVFLLVRQILNDGDRGRQRGAV